MSYKTIVERYLSLDKMSDPNFGHDGNTDCIHDLLDHLGIRHPRHPTLLSYICRDPLESHNGTCPASSAILACSALRLIWRPQQYILDDIHNHPSVPLARSQEGHIFN